VLISQALQTPKPKEERVQQREKQGSMSSQSPSSTSQLRRRTSFFFCNPLADTKKWRWDERQEATILSLFHSFWPKDQAIEHTLLDFWEVELAANFFQLGEKPLPIRERWRAFLGGQVGE
jgi:hypothetical protein